MAPSRPGSGRTALLVLGAPGAGGAVLARVLEAARGAPPADPAAVAALSDRTLRALGSGREDPFGPRRRGGGPAAPAGFDAEARALLRTAEPHAPLLVLADGGAARLPALWTAALEAEGWRVAHLLLLRAPGEAAAVAAAAGVPRHRALLLWASSMLEGERASRGGRRVVVAYDRLRADPEAELDRIERALALRLPRRTWDSAAEIEALLRDAPHAPPSPSALPEALAPLAAFADHLAAAAADEPGNADVPAETERWFASLSEIAAPLARRADAGPDASAEAPATSAVAAPSHDIAAEAVARADAAEAQVAILQSALTVARRRSAEAEILLQARATQASAGERDARGALAAALASREAAEADLARARERVTELDGEVARRDGRVEALAAAVRVSEAARAAQGAELDDERDRHGDARERLALVGVANHAAQTRVRELEARLRDEEQARRRRWLPRLLGLR